MKKIFFIAGIIVLGTVAVLMSCGPINKTSYCYCTTTSNVSQSQFESDLEKAMKSVGNGDCSDVESVMRGYGYKNVSCD